LKCCEVKIMCRVTSVAVRVVRVACGK
jgi:hypothetical protein